MRSIVAFASVALFVLVQAAERQLETNRHGQSVNLICRSCLSWPLHRSDLDSTTMAKPGQGLPASHGVLPSRNTPLLVSGSPFQAVACRCVVPVLQSNLRSVRQPRSPRPTRCCSILDPNEFRKGGSKEVSLDPNEFRQGGSEQGSNGELPLEPVPERSPADPEDRIEMWERAFASLVKGKKGAKLAAFAWDCYGKFGRGAIFVSYEKVIEDVYKSPAPEGQPQGEVDIEYVPLQRWRDTVPSTFGAEKDRDRVVEHVEQYEPEQSIIVVVQLGGILGSNILTPRIPPAEIAAAFERGNDRREGSGGAAEQRSG
eukprot:gnl/TRDRNA2_/TRDRNA2_28012_c0_seq1.p1 gnl/TRDRNA2_/TRDRNA2_28012_c0~~gnl/TRDRNA2_/TRDRNA2_28012_c0_seq1.p1  ORF type:complete len:314 (-),score=33.31 gnl/TRDRNA2_/TRDRNA2_28012_c0_seq1:101-1042(-)